jgi:hypothetical protein
MTLNFNPENIKDMSIADIIPLIHHLKEKKKQFTKELQIYALGSGPVGDELILKIAKHKFMISVLSGELNTRIDLIFPNT